MSLSSDQLTLALSPRSVRYYDSIGSTNDAATEWLLAGAPNGSVVVADEQTHGRGRFGRTWYTPPQTALAVSVILYPDIAHLPQVNMAAALAIQEAVKVLGAEDVTLKWPNDVLLGERKICGILPEIARDSDNVARGVVLGIGVNVRNGFAGTALEASATSLEAALQRPVERTALLSVILFRLEHWLGQLGSAALLNSYQAAISFIGQPITLYAVDVTYHGVAARVASDGALIVRFADGREQAMYAGEVSLHSAGNTV